MSTNIPDGVPCKHPGCLSHISHPCEGCGRIGGRSSVEIDVETEIFIGERKGAWKIVYVDDGITRPGFYFVNAGDPKTYSPASKTVVFDILKKLVATQQDKTCFNCGGNVNTSTGYRICERGCGGPVAPPAQQG